MDDDQVIDEDRLADWIKWASLDEVPVQALRSQVLYYWLSNKT